MEAGQLSPGDREPYEEPTGGRDDIDSGLPLRYIMAGCAIDGEKMAVPEIGDSLQTGRCFLGI